MNGNLEDTDVFGHLPAFPPIQIPFSWAAIMALPSIVTSTVLWIACIFTIVPSPQNRYSTFTKTKLPIPLRIWLSEADGGSEPNSTLDSSVYNDDGTVYQAAWSATGDADGNGAYIFDGSNDYIDLADSASLDIDSEITLIAWVYPETNQAAYTRILGRSWATDVAPWSAYMIQRQTGAQNFSFYISHSNGTTTGSGYTTSAAPLNQWSMIAATYDGTRSKVYFNGNLEATGSDDAGDIATNNLPVRIGGNYYGREFFDGRINNVQIYNHALTEDQIAAIYNNGTIEHNVIASQETLDGEDWQACIVPNTGGFDGTLVCSNEITIKPGVTDAAISVSGATGTGGAYKVGDTVVVTWNNSASGDNNTTLTVAPTADLSGWGGSSTATMTDTTACGGTATDDIYEACFTLVSGSIDDTGVNASVSATNTGGTTTVSDTTGATVDNELPSITANGTLTITTDNGVVSVAALNNGTCNQDKVTQSAVTLSAADSDTTTIDLTALTGEATLAATTQSNVVTPGALDSATQTFTITVTDNAGNTATTVSDAISVDNILPTVTASAISVTGATGAGGVFVAADTPTGRWDDSGTGDNNTDTISSVSFNLSDWISTATAVSGSAAADIWTTAAQSPLDSQNTTNNNTAVTVTDNAGNITTTAGTNNYTIEALATVDTVVLTGEDETDDLSLSYNMTPASARAIVDWTVDSSSIAVLNMPFEGNGGSESTSTLDYSTNSNDGTVSGATWSGAGGVDGHGAYSFNGTSNYINTGTFNPTDPNHVTLSAWFNTNEITASSGIYNNIIIMKGYDSSLANSYGIVLYSSNSNPLNGGATFVVNPTGSTPYYAGSGEGVVTANTWHHVVGVIDGTTMKMYFDGVPTGSRSLPTPLSTSSNSVRIGGQVYQP